MRKTTISLFLSSIRLSARLEDRDSDRPDFCKISCLKFLLQLVDISVLVKIKQKKNKHIKRLPAYIYDNISSWLVVVHETHCVLWEVQDEFKKISKCNNETQQSHSEIVNLLIRYGKSFVCVCVCVCEREREREINNVEKYSSIAWFLKTLATLKYSGNYKTNAPQVLRSVDISYLIYNNCAI
jgi:hypothetical protein